MRQRGRRAGASPPCPAPPMIRLDERYQTSAGRVAAARMGSGPPLVLAHGWPWSSQAWHRVAGRFAETYRVHVYDMPGFGASDKAGPRPNGLDTQGDVFGEMLELWGFGADSPRPAVVAHDFGGAVSLRAHVLGGWEFERLVLMNVVALSPWGSAFFDHVGQHVAAFEGLPPHIHAAVVEAYIRGALVSPLPEEDVAMLVAPWCDAEGQRAFYAQFALADDAFTDAIAPHLSTIRCPVRVLWGEHDPWIPVERGEALAEQIGTPLMRLGGLGHLPQLEDPDRVASALMTALGD